MLKKFRAIHLYLFLTLLFLLPILFGPFLLPYQPLELDLDQIWQSPSPLHLAGTDNMGRDILVRLMYGGRTSLLIALLVELVAFPLGSLLGYLGGTIDRFWWEPVNQLMDVLFAFPTMILAMLAASFLGRGILTITLTAAIVEIPIFYIYIQRIVRQIRQQSFIENLRVIGVSESRIFLFHILPHIAPLLAPKIVFNFATTIVFESTLSFLGLGIQVPAPSWGNMISDGIKTVKTYPWLVISSSLCLAMTTFLLFGISEQLQVHHGKGKA